MTHRGGRAAQARIARVAPPLSLTSSGRAVTLQRVPDHDVSDELRELEAAYVAGDFARLRRSARTLLAREGVDAETAAQARAYADRIRVDPITLGMLAFSALLFLTLTLRYAV